MSTRAKTAMLLLAAIAAALAISFAASGCGDDDDDSPDQNEVSTEILDQAEDTSSKASLESAQRAEDRYLPGPMEMRAVCSQPTPPPQPDTPYQLRCHVEGFGTPPNADNFAYMTYEDWLVPVDSTGKVGEPTIQGTYRIRTYRRKDNRLNCTNRKARPEKCAPPVPGQEVAPPPTAPQGEGAPSQPAPLNP
jgi:hypothetical protein